MKETEVQPAETEKEDNIDIPVESEPVIEQERYFTFSLFFM